MRRELLPTCGIYSKGSALRDQLWFLVNYLQVSSKSSQKMHAEPALNLLKFTIKYIEDMIEASEDKKVEEIKPVEVEKDEEDTETPNDFDLIPSEASTKRPAGRQHRK